MLAGRATNVGLLLRCLSAAFLADFTGAVCVGSSSSSSEGQHRLREAVAVLQERQASSTQADGRRCQGNKRKLQEEFQFRGSQQFLRQVFW